MLTYIIFIIIAYLIIGFVEIVPLYRKKQTREMVLYISIFTIALALSILIATEIKVPSPAKAMGEIVMSILGK